MRDLAKIRLRTLAWLILPITVVVLIPWGLRRLMHQTVQWHAGGWQWIGVWLIVNGLGLAAWCVNLFNVVGRGTPLPLDPPKQFVTRGPYRYVRNPMMLGVLVVVAGEALIFQSRAIGLYLLILMLAAHLFVSLWEEPDLRRRFGPTYQAYCKQVPRWIPRLPGHR